MHPCLISGSSTLICVKLTLKNFIRGRESLESAVRRRAKRRKIESGEQKICESEGGANRGVFITAWHVDFVRSVWKTGEIRQARDPRVDNWREKWPSISCLSFFLLFFFSIPFFFVRPLLIPFFSPFLFSSTRLVVEGGRRSPARQSRKVIRAWRSEPLISSVLSLFSRGRVRFLWTRTNLDFEARPILRGSRQKNTFRRHKPSETERDIHRALATSVENTRRPALSADLSPFPSTNFEQTWVSLSSFFPFRIANSCTEWKELVCPWPSS